MKKNLDTIGFGLTGLSIILLCIACLCALYEWNSLEKPFIAGTIISFAISIIILTYKMMTDL